MNPLVKKPMPWTVSEDVYPGAVDRFVVKRDGEAVVFGLDYETAKTIAAACNFNIDTHANPISVDESLGKDRAWSKAPQEMRDAFIHESGGYFYLDEHCVNAWSWFQIGWQRAALACRNSGGSVDDVLWRYSLSL